MNEGTKAIRVHSSSAVKKGSLVNDGIQTASFARANANQPGTFHFYLKEGNKVIVDVYTGPTGKFFYYDGDLENYIGFGGPGITLRSDGWRAIQIQWRSSDHKVRYNIDGASWTNWTTPIADWNAGLDTVEISALNVIYFDTFEENPFVEKLTPVLIVPGVTGTEIKSQDNLLWANLGQMSIDIDDNFMDPLKFNQNLTPLYSNLSLGGVIKKLETAIGLIDFDYSEALITELKNQGYVENENIFTFPYDWRYGVSGQFSDGTNNVDLLKQKIENILTQTGASEVDIVAHSMGGLLVKKLVMDNSGNHNIGKSVFVGVPNTGAPEAVKTLLQGDNLGIPWLSQNKIKEISENMPSIYDLLPSQQYYDNKGSYVEVIDYGNFPGFNPIVKNLNQSETQSFLINDHNLNYSAQVNSTNLHSQSFDNFDLRNAGVDLYSINGCKKATISKITESKRKNIFGQSFIEYKNLKYTPGDGTVPLESATNLPISQENKYYALVAEHGRMLSQDGIRQQIVNILKGGELSVSNQVISQDIGDCQLNGKAISVFSPIDVLVKDQDDNKLGLAEDGSIINEIPNANFEILGEHKFIYLPTQEGQVYDIDIDGTGSGFFTIKNQDIENGQVVKTEVFSGLQATESLTGQMIFEDDGTSLILQDTEELPEKISPSSVVNANQSEDLLSPISNVNLTGAKGQEGFYRSDVVLEVNSSDQVVIGQENQTSGVLNIHYNLDNSGWQKTEENYLNLKISKEGSHDISFFATDNAGNSEQTQNINFTIDKTSPEAIIQFDQKKNKFLFSGIDNISGGGLLSVLEQSNLIKITDQAGNYISLYFSQKNSTNLMLTEKNPIKYNGLQNNSGAVQVKYTWSTDRSNNLTKIFQYAKSGVAFISLNYNNRQTKVSGLDSSSVKISEKFNGLKPMVITTNKGTLNWNY